MTSRRRVALRHEKWLHRDPVDYNDTFIAVADDSAATVGTVPPAKPESPSVASRTFEMIWRHPYKYTSGELIERWTLLPDGLARTA